MGDPAGDPGRVVDIRSPRTAQCPLNVNRLGVDVRAYHPDFYGEMTDAINAGDRTDRLVAWWVVDSDRAAQAASGETADPGPR